MPATESTWRDTSCMHRIFAVTGVVLTIGTVWMFWKDHARSWKAYPGRQVVNIDLKMNELRQEQFETGDAVLDAQRGWPANWPRPRRSRSMPKRWRSSSRTLTS